MEGTGLNVQVLNGGLGRRTPTADMVTGVVMNAVATEGIDLSQFAGR